MPLHLYFIIVLLITNITTASLWLWNRSTIVELEDKIVLLEAAKNNKEVIIEVKEKTITIVDTICEKKLKDIQAINKKLNKSKAELNKLYADAMNVINNTAKTSTNSQPSGITYDEAKEIVDYLSTPIPNRILVQLQTDFGGKAGSDYPSR